MVFLRGLRLLSRAFVDESSPRQVAAGMAMGLGFGLVPSDSLFAMLLVMLLSALKINLAAGLFGLFVSAWLGMLLDGALHTVGEWVLTQPMLNSLFVWMANQPLLPWTRFNNTVVMGSLLVGLVAVYPLYRMLLPLASRYVPPVKKWIAKYKLARVLLGTEWLGKIQSVGAG